MSDYPITDYDVPNLSADKNGPRRIALEQAAANLVGLYVDHLIAADWPWMDSRNTSAV